MSEVLSGDEWKHAKEPVRELNRAQLQAKLNADYATGKLTLEQWRKGPDHLSGCDKSGEPVLPKGSRR